MNNSFNVPASKIRGYVAEDSPEDNTTQDGKLHIVMLHLLWQNPPNENYI